MKKYYAIACLFFVGFATSNVFGQETIISLKDSANQKPVSNAIVQILNDGTYYYEEAPGVFRLPLDKSETTEIYIQKLGFENKKIEINRSDINGDTVRFQLAPQTFAHDQVVVSASRVSEQMNITPSTIYKLGLNEIENAPTNDFYQSLGYYPEVDIIQNSFGFKVLNIRGFQSTSPFRNVQLIDGIDNMSPGLSFSVGNAYGVNNMDVSSVELLTGPASAVYGPNALQGLLYIHTKDPFSFPGFEAKMSAGNRDYSALDMRYATTLDKKKKWGVKFNFSGFRAKEWLGQDSSANLYGNIPTPPMNLPGMFMGQLNNPNLTASQQAFYSDFQSYTNANPNTALTPTQFRLPGYMESELIDPNIYNVKTGVDVYRRYKKGQVRLFTKYSKGTQIFQGNNRAYLNDYWFLQSGVSATYDKLKLNLYMNKENSGNTYLIPATGINLGFAGLGNYAQTYIDDYILLTEAMSNNYNDPLSDEQVAQIHAQASESAASAYPEPGTAQFETIKENITTNPNPPNGSKAINKSTLFHGDLQYTVPVKPVDVLLGFSFRKTYPNSEGTVFLDTMTADGSFSDISFFETGGFVSVGKSFFRDKLKLQGVLRLDKSQNFDLQVSPRFSVNSKLNRHHSIYTSYQHAFRNPSINDQFLRVNAGSFISTGNLNGFDNVYTESSVNEYFVSKDASVLEATIIDPVQPEKLKAIELGYRLNYRKVSGSLVGYFNIYDNFLGAIRVVQPDSGVTGENSGVQDLNTRNFQTYAVAANSSSTIYTSGFSAHTSVYPVEFLRVYGNYTYSKLVKTENEDPLVPGFNTPEHRFNLGFQLMKLFDHVDINSNFKWVDTYYWQSAFADGDVPSYYLLDLSASVYPKSEKIVLQVGASNLLDNQHIEAYGGGLVGRFIYSSIKVRIP